MARVTVGCKLPNGIILDHPGNPDNKVVLSGRNKSVIVGADYATTEVDADFFAAWMDVNKEFPAVVSGAIFVAKNPNEAAAMAKDLVEETTGFEPMRTDGKDTRAKGVAKADQD